MLIIIYYADLTIIHFQEKYFKRFSYEQPHKNNPPAETSPFTKDKFADVCT